MIRGAIGLDDVVRLRYATNVGRIRAALPQFLLQAVEGFEPERRDRALSQVSPQTLDAIRSKLPIGWLEMTLHMEFVEHLARAVGPEEYVSLWTASGRNFMERPIVGGLVGMAKRLFFTEPREAVRYLPRMYSVGVEGLGEVTVEDNGEHMFVVKLRGFPASRWDFDNYVLGLAGATQGACAVMFPAWPLDIGFDPPDHDHGAVDYRLTLRPERSDDS